MSVAVVWLRRNLRLDDNRVLDAAEPARVPAPEVVLSHSCPSIPLDGPHGLGETGAPRNPKGGAAEARRTWDAFRASALLCYAEKRDRPDLAGTSRLSPHLRFGTIGIRRVLAEARAARAGAPPSGKKGIETFVKELCWREFYAGILHTFPRVLTENFRKEFDTFGWVGGEEAERHFAAWTEGRTGYPIVDARAGSPIPAPRTCAGGYRSSRA